MKPLQLSIQAIRAALKEEPSTFPVDEAAIIYARHCAEAEQRLDRLAAMLQKGSEYQALQVAEEEPPLLDLVAMLSFGDEKAWQGHCEARGLPIATKLNAKVVQQLEALYAKGISAHHPLYKDFRAAVLARDDVKSLHIVRTILKLNPSDENARKELLRLENKHLQEKAEQLREALKSDNEERIASLTEELKSLAPMAKLERLDAYHQGEAVRVALRRRQAEQQLPELLNHAATLSAQGGWREMGLLLEEVTTLVKDHALEPLPETQARQRQTLTAHFQTETAAEEKRRAFDRCLKDFVRYVGEIETRLRITIGVTFNELAGRDETFVKRWKELEAFHLPVPDETLQRLRKAGQDLRARLAGMQRMKSIKTITRAAAVVLLLGAITAVSLHGWKAWSLTQELAGYRTRGAPGPAGDLIQKLRRDEPLLLRWPFLQAKTEETASWVKNAGGTEREVDAALAEIEQTFTGDSSSLPPGTLVKKIADLKLLIPQLAVDLARPAQNRLKTLETKRDIYLATELKKIESTAGQSLAELETLSADQLSYDKPATQVAASCKQLEDRLRPLEQLLKAGVDGFTLPTDLEVRITTQRRLLDTYQTDAATFDAVRAETAQATTLADFKTALQKWQDVKFAEAAPALPMIEALPTEKSFQAALLTGGDESTLQAVIDDKSTRYMAPAKATELDQSTILGLMHDENLNGIFESTLVDYTRGGATSLLFSRGRPTESGTGLSYKWSAKFFEPDSTGTAAIFVERSFNRSGDPALYLGHALSSIHASKTSQSIAELNINRLLDEKGERVMGSLLEVMEKIVRADGASPIARAYVMLKMENMMRARPFEWGLHLCPSLEQDLHTLHTLLGNKILRSEDWMVTPMREKWSKPLGSFFSQCKDRQYYREAGARRDYLRAAANAGLRLIGHVGLDGSMKLNQSGLNAIEWWVVSTPGKKPLLVTKQGIVRLPAQPGQTASLETPHLMSPLFEVRADRRDLVQKYQKALHESGVAESRPKPPTGESVYLTAP